MPPVEVVLLGGTSGGAEGVTLQLAAGLANGSQVQVHVLRRPRSPAGIALLPIQIMRIIRSIRHGMRRDRSLIVMTTHSDASVLLAALKRLRILPKQMPLLIRESTRIFARLQGWRAAIRTWLYRLTYPGASALICQTGEMAGDLAARLPAACRSLILVLPNPVAANRIEAEAGQTPQHILPDAFMVAAGRLIPEKGYFDLIAAYAALQSSVNLPLLILGDGPLRTELEVELRRRGLNHRVYLLGHLPNPYPIYRRATLGVVSSRIEGFPNTVLEMMLLCPRVVATRCADGVAQLPGVTHCPPADPVALAGAIQRTLQQPPTASVMAEYVRDERSVGKTVACLRRALQHRGLSL